MISSIKSWLYSDMLEKPEEMTMFRPRGEGGLGVQNIRFKSLAIRIKAFLETAVNPEFITNIFHEALFKWHILGERGIKDPGTPAYYKNDFFKVIKEVFNQKRFKMVKMSTSDWYKVLLEKNVTTEVNEDGIRKSKPTRVESKSPEVNWERTWDLANTRGISSLKTSFLLKLLYNITD